MADHTNLMGNWNCFKVYNIGNIIFSNKYIYIIVEFFKNSTIYFERQTRREFPKWNNSDGLKVLRYSWETSFHLGNLFVLLLCIRLFDNKSEFSRKMGKYII